MSLLARDVESDFLIKSITYCVNTRKTFTWLCGELIPETITGKNDKNTWEIRFTLLDNLENLMFSALV